MSDEATQLRSSRRLPARTASFDSDGGVWSSLIVLLRDIVVDRSRLVAVQVNVVPGVSAVSVMFEQPVDEERGPLNDQSSVTLLTCQPFWPSVPYTLRLMSGTSPVAPGASASIATAATATPTRRPTNVRGVAKPRFNPALSPCRGNSGIGIRRIDAAPSVPRRVLTRFVATTPFRGRTQRIVKLIVLLMLSTLTAGDLRCGSCASVVALATSRAVL